MFDVVFAGQQGDEVPVPPTIQPWQVCTNKAMQRRYGKLLEELGELASVVARCTIQGVDEVDPSSGFVNRERLENEIADVLCQLELTVDVLGLNRERMKTRQWLKSIQMAQWEMSVNDEKVAEV